MYKCTMYICCYMLGSKDFTEMNSTLRFLPGERRKVISLTILDDLLLEENEVFNVLISADDDRVAVARGNSSIIITDSDGIKRLCLLY